MNCYNCGIELTNKTNHKEHVPAKNIFATYPPEYKLELLTVPACFTCNNKFSKIDQEIRDAIGVLNNNNELQKEMSLKAAKSILRSSNWINRVISIDGGQKLEVSFNYNDLKKLHIKNFKGLFYKKYGFPISDKDNKCDPPRYEIEIIAEGDESNERLQSISKLLYNYANEGIEWNTIGHEDVFQYKMKAMILGENGVIYDAPDIKEALGFVCIMHYHKTIKPLIIACESELINNIAHRTGN